MKYRIKRKIDYVLVVAMIVVSNTSLMIYAPALLVAGVLAGILIGVLTKEVVGRLPLNL